MGNKRERTFLRLTPTAVHISLFSFPPPTHPLFVLDHHRCSHARTEQKIDVSLEPLVNFLLNVSERYASGCCSGGFLRRTVIAYNSSVFSPVFVLVRCCMYPLTSTSSPCWSCI